MRKALFALAALAATALAIAFAWVVTLLFSGALALPRWAAILILVAVLAGAHFLRWRRRR